MNQPLLQESLATAIADSAADHSFSSAGIGIYRRNLAASAARALAISYPTTTLLVGETLLALFARQFLAEAGKQVGDWGRWGSGFPAWLQRHPISREHPYLADTARVDWAVHVSGRSRDTRTDDTSMRLIELCDLSKIYVVYAPGTKLLHSGFPVVDIVNNHRANPAAPDLAPIRQKLERGIGQSALVVRKNFAVQIREPLRCELPWLQLIAGKQSLGSIDTTPGDLPMRDWLSIGFETQLIEKLTTNPNEV